MLPNEILEQGSTLQTFPINCGQVLTGQNHQAECQTVHHQYMDQRSTATSANNGMIPMRGMHCTTLDKEALPKIQMEKLMACEILSRVFPQSETINVLRVSSSHLTDFFRKTALPSSVCKDLVIFALED